MTAILQNADWLGTPDTRLAYPDALAERYFKDALETYLLKWRAG